MSDPEDIRRNVRWYQTILATAGGYGGVPISGNHNDPVTRSAFRDFQHAHGLEATSFLTVESNIALNQTALEWLYRRRLPITTGKPSEILRDQIKEFQADYGLEADGKVGPVTMEQMMSALNGTLPRPCAEWEPELGPASFLDEPDTADRPQQGLILGAPEEDEGVIGTDDRDSQTDTLKEPNRWVCLLDIAADLWDIQYDDSTLHRPLQKVRNGFAWSLGGSGVLISPRHVLTAAHVVHTYYDRDSSGRYRKMLMASTIRAAPGYNGAFAGAAPKMFRQPYGVAETERYMYGPGYAVCGKYTCAMSSFDDFALIELPKPIHLRAPKQTRRFLLDGKWHEEHKQLPPLGYWGSGAGFEIKAIVPKDLDGQEIHTVGYPQTLPRVDTKPRKKWMQWLAKGKVDSRVNNRANHPALLYHTADTTNSQSGSPMWTVSRSGSRIVHSLVGIAITADVNRNTAVALTDRVLRQIQEWAPDTFDYKAGVLTVKSAARSASP